MLKKLLIGIVIVSSILAAGCSVDDEQPKKEVGGNSSSSENSEQKEDKKDEKFKAGDTAVFETLKITAGEVETNTGSEYFEPEDGNVFVGVKFTIENISEESQSISSIMLFEPYVDDVKTELSFNAQLAFDDGGTLDGDLSPGKKMVGYYTLEVPKDAEKITLEFKSDWLSDAKAEFEFNMPE